MTARTQRQDFEAWAKRQGYDVTCYDDCGDERAFYSDIVQMMWEAWQAAAVEKEHGNNEYGRRYRAAVALIEAMKERI